MNNYTTISTVRHAQTDYNREKRYAGTTDVPLNEIGVGDAIEASQKIRDIKFDVVISSRLKRAIETTNLLVDGRVPHVQSKLCNERNYGKMQRLTFDEVKLIKPEIIFIKVGADIHSVNPPEGESFELLRERAKKFYRFIFNNYEGSNILIVSHGVFLQQFHGLLRGKSCIESLAIEVPDLELLSFRFDGSRLIGEKSTRLIDCKQISW